MLLHTPDKERERINTPLKTKKEGKHCSWYMYMYVVITSHRLSCDNVAPLGLVESSNSLEN